MCGRSSSPAVLSALRPRPTRGLLSWWAVDAGPQGFILHGFILHGPSCCQIMVSYIFCCSSAPLSTLWVRASVCVAGVSLLVVHLRVCFFAPWYKYHTLLDITGVSFQFPDTPDLRIRRRHTPGGFVAVRLPKVQIPADIMGCFRGRLNEEMAADRLTNKQRRTFIASAKPHRITPPPIPGRRRSTSFINPHLSSS